jgi:fatty-acyl-CoA synthase
MNNKDWIKQWAVYSPTKTVVRLAEDGRKLSYEELDRLSDKASHLLSEQYRLKTGDRVAVIAEFCLEYLVLFSVAQRLGITLIPVNYRLSAREVTYILNNGEPSLVFYEESFKHLLAEAPAFPVCNLAEFSRQLAQQDALKPYPSAELEEDHPLFILYTSGTTGFPKGALYTHKMAFWNSINTALRLNLSAYDHTVICLPPFHTGGWNVLMTPLLQFGGSFTLMRKFDAGHLLRIMDEEQVTIFMGVPTMLKMMTDSEQFEKARLQSVRYFIVGGESLPIPVIEKWATKGIAIRQGFGLTECGPNITSLHHKDAIRKKGSIGQPNFYIQMRLVDENNQDVQPGEIGELLIKGPIVTPGYWKNPEATRQAFHEGWFRTGDLLTQDRDGYLFVKDRIKHMYISGGENVYPAEVEHLLRQHKAISEVAVIGVPDEHWGEAGKAFIVLADNHSLDQLELTDWCKGRLAKFKTPKHICFVRELPKNDTVKIDRKRLKELGNVVPM